ncbi:hypothetical protein [Corynebacterium cystitidis]|uniref:hypothetical protein n=1 Tax=Corynebacterium cystitidis TaxID=35757 RepID=UPI00211F1605|nr:hypothetical protein [Corynebacterium cystitidis]
MFSAKPHILIPGDPAFDDLERWEWTDDALQNFLALRNRDADAFNWIYANMKQWNREGYHPITRQDQKAMEAPSGFDAAQQVDHPPWMG